jgi:hypothetical protein
MGWDSQLKPRYNGHRTTRKDHMAFPLTRRQLLASVATGCAAFSPCGLIFAQGAKRIEQFAPELDGIVSIGEPINQLADGVGGDGGLAEGPVWWKEGGCLLFSDINGKPAHEIHARSGDG